MGDSNVEERAMSSDEDTMTLEDFLRQPKPTQKEQPHAQQAWAERDRQAQEAEKKRSRSASKESFQTAQTNKSKEELQAERILERSRAILKREEERSKEEVDFMTFIAESGKKPLSVLLAELDKEEEKEALQPKMDSVSKPKNRRQTNFARFLPMRKIAFVDNKGGRVLSPLKSSAATSHKA